MILYSVQQRRKSSLKLRRGSLEEDSNPISVVYNPRVDVVELNNAADGTATIDSSSEPPVSDLVSEGPHLLVLHWCLCSAG